VLQSASAAFTPTFQATALMLQFQATADAKKEQAHEQVKNLLVGAGVVAVLIWLLNSKGYTPE